jgi:spore maturation protein CgeB
MAQFLGSGLLLATSSASGYQRYFDDDEMIFFNSARDLADKIDAVLVDDTRWRRMAERGREKALATMAGERVTDFIVSMTLGLGVPPGWRFADHIYLD